MPKQSTMYPFTRYRVQRVDTGGGYSETLGTAITVWADIPCSTADAEPEIDMNEDVRVGDIIEYEEYL